MHCTERFKKGRQFLNNVVKLDHTERVDAMVFGDSLMDAGKGFHSDARLFHRDLIDSTPLLLLFDYAAAFPSAAHTWILLILTFLKLPFGLFLLVQALYHRSLAYLGSQEGLVLCVLFCLGSCKGAPVRFSLCDCY